jgi:isocitrate lyase
LTDEEEEAIAIRGTCPICHAKDGDRCTNAEGKVLEPGKLHLARLRASRRAAEAN